MLKSNSSCIHCTHNVGCRMLQVVVQSSGDKYVLQVSGDVGFTSGRSNLVHHGKVASVFDFAFQICDLGLELLNLVVELFVLFQSFCQCKSSLLR